MEEYAEKIARAFKNKGTYQYSVCYQRHDKVFVIEANPRASRTTPFIAKAYQIPYLNVATKSNDGRCQSSKDFTFEKKLNGFAIKEPVFSFQ